MTFSLTILGCGSSGGVPRVGQGWGACDPTNPRNRRRRCSVLLRQKASDGRTTQVLIDTSPDLREQLLDQAVEQLDAVFLTHSHADHTHGIDDVRPLVIRGRKRIDVHMDVATSEVVRNAFGYIFETPVGSSYPPLLVERRLTPLVSATVEGPGGPVTLTPFRLHHGEIDALGFRIGAVAYTPDVNAIPEESLSQLADLDLWIVDALRYTRHPSHFSLSETLEWLDRLKPRRAVLTNLHTDLDYEALKAQLPGGVTPAFDGMDLDDLP